jgi:hypothetical protein
MEKILVRWFYRGFWIAIILCFLTITILAICLVDSWNKYIQGEYKMIVLIMLIGLLVLFTILYIIWLLPSFRDLPAVRKRNFEKINGTILRYKRVQHGGEPPTHSWHPIVRNNSTGEEIELIIAIPKEREEYVSFTKTDENAPEFYGTYNFIYLKNTKLAVIDKLSILKK